MHSENLQQSLSSFMAELAVGAVYSLKGLRGVLFIVQAGNDIVDRVLSRIFRLGGKLILKKMFEPRGSEKNFF